MAHCYPRARFSISSHWSRPAEIHPWRKGWVGSRTPNSWTASCRGKRRCRTRCVARACRAPSTLPPRRPGFKSRSLPPEQARLQRPCRGSVPCSRFSYARAESEPRVSCQFVCQSLPPLFGAGSVSRNPRAVALCPSPIHLPDGRTAGCLHAPRGRFDSGRPNHQGRHLGTPTKSECWYVLVQEVRTAQAARSFSERR